MRNRDLKSYTLLIGNLKLILIQA